MRERLLVHRVVERAGDDAAVDHQMVDVAVVDEAFLVAQGVRGGDLDDVPGAAGRVPGGAEVAMMSPADLEVRVRRVALGVDQHGARGRDGRDDVDVAAGAELLRIPGQSARQPDDVGGAEGAGQLGLDVGLAEPGVAARIQLHRLGDQDRALTVHVDAAALVDQR